MGPISAGARTKPYFCFAFSPVFANFASRKRAMRGRCPVPTGNGPRAAGKAGAMRKSLLLAILSALSPAVLAGDELVRFGDFESWFTREVKESALVGGKTVTLHEVGPERTWPRNSAFTSLPGCPWRTSNVYAKVAGVVKSNVSAYPDTHGSGKCVKLVTHELACKAMGVVNITVVATGSMFTGGMVEPVTGSSNPMAKMDAGVPFTRRPKAIKFDYKVKLSDAKRICETGTGRKREVQGRDCCEAFILLQRRWEDGSGNIHAKRVGTMWKRFSQSCEWKEGASFDIHYGDITGSQYYQKFMELQNAGSERAYYARNSKGKMVMVVEEGWADAGETPTHMLIVFNSSHGKAYEGSPGNTMWVDNVTLVY